MPSVQLFISIERSFRKRIHERLHAFSEEFKTRILNSLDGDNFARAFAEIDASNLGGALEQDSGVFELLGLSAVILGASQAKPSAITSALEIPSTFEANWLVENAAKQISLAVELLSVEHIKTAARNVVQGKVLDTPTELLSRGEAVSNVVLLKSADDDLATKLNAAVDAGTTVESNITANLVTSRLMQYGFLAEATAAGITSYQWNAILDGFTCPVCNGLHGKIFNVRAALDLTRLALSVINPNDLRGVTPFISQSKKSLTELKTLTDSQIQDRGFASPPAHPLCRCVLSLVGTVPAGEITGF